MAASLTGIPNVGNTCYIASVLQLIAHCPQLFMWLTVPGSTFSPRAGPVSFGLHKAMTDMKDNITPRVQDLVKTLKQSKHIHLDLRVQNDAHELLVQLIDGLAEENNRAHPRAHTGAHDRSKLLRAMNADWARSAISPLHDIVGGQKVIQMKCGHCGKLSHSSEVFTVFHLDVPYGASQATVEECLEHTFKDEYIDSDWKCERCHGIASRSSPAKRSARLWRSPQALLLSFVNYGVHQGRASVISVPESLQLDSAFCKFSPHYASTYARYRATSLVSHYGTHTSGHYTACVRRPGRWYTCDDSRVSEGCPRSNPYMAAYTVWPQVRTSRAK